MREPVRVVLDRPADRLLVDRAELLTGWIEPLADGAGPATLTATCGGRPLAVRRCWHPEMRWRPHVAGFWAMLVVQELLPAAAAGGELAVDLAADGAHLATVHLRISPVAAHLARAYPLNLREYPVPPRDGAAAAPPSLVFPGLGAVGGASLNQLLRRKMLAAGWPVPVHFEADHPALWRSARAADPRPPRWIDGHACYGAAASLGTRAARVTLLREPAVRMLSIYNYNALVHPYDFPFATLDEFLASDAAARATQAASLLRMAGLDVDPAAGADEIYARARDLVRSAYALVGVTECFEETIFLVCQLAGIDAIGMWWMVLSAPGRPAVAALPAPTRRRLDALVAADRRLYEDARRALTARVEARRFGAPLARYKADAAAAPELPDEYKLVECLRWRQVLADAELRALRAAAGAR